MLLIFILLSVLQLVTAQRKTWSIINETFQARYIFQVEYTGNYTDHIGFCRTLHNAELLKFDSNEEYEFIYQIVLKQGGFIIGLYIPPNADYRSLYWYDGSLVDLSKIQLRFRNGLPSYSSSFRYFYFRLSFGDLASGNWYGGAICKQSLDSTTSKPISTAVVSDIKTSPTLILVGKSYALVSNGFLIVVFSFISLSSF